MRLLVITQKVDVDDSNLGFFHIWLEKLAERVEQLFVICLQKGEYKLPNNVTVLSLGKEQRSVSSVRYAIRFYSCLWRLRGKYDNIFVHMNPEYAILAGWYWRFSGKKVLLWYVHKAVNFRLWLAEKFVTKIFTASKESFRLPSKKVEVVGHGIPVENFSNILISPPAGRLAILSVGRISATKKHVLIVQAIDILRKKLDHVTIVFRIIGSTLTREDKNTAAILSSKLNGEGHSAVVIGVNSTFYSEMPKAYQEADLLVHASDTGSIDKVVLEALAAGRIVVTSSEAYAALVDDQLEGVVYRFHPGDCQELAKTIEKIYQSGILNTIPNKQGIDYVRQHHNLDSLITKIISYFKSV